MEVPNRHVALGVKRSAELTESGVVQVAEDATRGVSRPLTEMVYDWLRAKHTSHEALVAAGYCLVMSLRCFSSHPEVKLALKVSVAL
jgi:hypothetical protein